MSATFHIVVVFFVTFIGGLKSDDAAHQLLQELKENVNISLAGITYEINYLDSLQNSMVENSVQAVQNQIEDFALALENIKNSSVDISECLDTNEDQLNDLGNLGLNNMKTCVEGLLKSLQRINQRALELINQTVENVNVLESAFDSCATDMECIADVSQQITEAYITVPNNLLSFSGFYGLYTERYNFLAKSCGKVHLDQIVQKGENILAEIRQCVDEIMV